MPDPTLLYRRPNSPRPRAEASPVVPPTVPSNPPRARRRSSPPSCATRSKPPVSRSTDLLDDERFAQAAELLQSVIAPAAAALGVEHPRVLPLRRGGQPSSSSAATIGRRCRNSTRSSRCITAPPAPVARKSWTAFGRRPTAEPSSARPRRHCSQFRQALTQVRVAGSDVSDTALDLRRNIGSLLGSDGRTVEAIAALQPLHEDLCVVYGPNHPETQEVADLLARLRLTT